MLWPDSLVHAGRGDTVIDDSGQRRPPCAAAEAAIVEEKDVDAGIEQIRHHVRGVREVARISVAVKCRGDGMLGPAVPAVKQFAVIRFERKLFGSFARDSVVLGVPTDDRLALRNEKLRPPENAPSEVEGKKDRRSDQQGVCCFRKQDAFLFSPHD